MFSWFDYCWTHWTPFSCFENPPSFHAFGLPCTAFVTQVEVSPEATLAIDGIELHRVLGWKYGLMDRSDRSVKLWYLPSGKRLHNYGKIHHFQWENPLFLWWFLIGMLVITRGYSLIYGHWEHELSKPWDHVTMGFWCSNFEVTPDWGMDPLSPLILNTSTMAELMAGWKFQHFRLRESLNQSLEICQQSHVWVVFFFIFSEDPPSLLKFHKPFDVISSMYEKSRTAGWGGWVVAANKIRGWSLTRTGIEATKLVMKSTEKWGCLKMLG